MTEAKRDFAGVFEFLGVSLSEKSGKQARGDCPICLKDGHFFVNQNDGRWDCKLCQASGNLIRFLDFTYTKAAGNTKPAQLKRLAEQRRIPWKLARNHLDVAYSDMLQRWMIPVRGPSGLVGNLRLYSPELSPKMLGLPSMGLGLYGAEKIANPAYTGPVYVCEGEWDAIALQALLANCGSNACTIGVPGAGVWQPLWANWLKDRDVVLCYDNDDAGASGLAAAGKSLLASQARVRYLQWPSGLEPGYDLSDLIAGASDTKPTSVLATLDSFLKPFGGEALTKPLKPISFNQLVKIYRAHLEMPADMVGAMQVSLATVLASKLKGDPLWVFLVSAPGGGKSVLLSSLRLSDRCVYRSSMTPASIVSGWDGSDDDPSLLKSIPGKCLITKDYTTILSLPPLVQEQILGVLRDAYDGSVQYHYGNAVSRKYDNCRFSFLAGVTPIIYAPRVSQATLGERFLRYQFHYSAEEDLAATLKAAQNADEEVEVDSVLTHSSACFLANQFPQELPKLSSPMRKRIVHLATFCAVMRTQVLRRGGMLDVQPQPEVATRLAKQLSTLLKLVAQVNGRLNPTAEDYALVKRVAFDSAGGWAMRAVTSMFDMPRAAKGFSVSALHEHSRLPIQNLYHWVEDACILGLLTHDGIIANGRPGKPATEYKPTDKLLGLWKQI